MVLVFPKEMGLSWLLVLHIFFFLPGRKKLENFNKIAI